MLFRWIGVVLALAYVCRPTASLAIVAFAIYVAVRSPAQLVRFLLGGAAVAAVFVVVNLATYGDVLPSYFRATCIGENDDLLEALAANLVSPSRGLFVFSPVLVLAVAGVVVKAPRHWS